jgi:signal transduction histidine kinase
VSRRLLLSYVLFVIFVLAVLEVPLGVAYQRSERRDLQVKVERDAVAVASLAEDGLEKPSAASRRSLGNLARSYRMDTGGRIVIVDSRGRSVADSAGAAGRSFASRPEFARALRGTTAVGTRFSNTLGTDLIYVAVPVASGGVVHGAARITYPTSAVDRRVRRYWLTLAAIAGVVLAIAAAVGVALARSIARPLRDLERAAAATGSGDLSVRAKADAGPPEVRTLAAAFNDSVGKLERVLRAQEDFVADASHQLRTPLTALRLRLENLERDVAEEGRGDLASAVAEVDRLGRLVTSLLELARADRGGAGPAVVELAPAVESRVAEWTPPAADRGVRVSAELAGDRLVALTSLERVEQVLDNLLENALEATPAGGSVAVTAARRNGWVELHVVDDGPGLSEDERARAFDRFWRGKPGGGGSGLGLAVVKRLVEVDGGEVSLASADGGGLDACVRLPAAP